MRIPIRIQLGSLLLISSLIGLAVISIAVWTTVHDFVLKLRATRLALTASLKAAQLDSNLEIMQTSAGFVSSRVIIQYSLQAYNDNGNNTDGNWSNSRSDMQAAIGGESSLGQMLLLQSRIYPRDATGVAGPYSLLNTTATSSEGILQLPYTFANGSRVTLGQPGTDLSFPPPLYPNLTYSIDGGAIPASYNGRPITTGQPLLLGPLLVNSTFSMVSLTTPIVNSTNLSEVLGYLTTVMSASLISTVMLSREGLGKTGETMIIGPADNTNQFSNTVINDAASNSGGKEDFRVQFVLPLPSTNSSRHPDHVYGSPNPAFNASEFPSIFTALDKAQRNASSETSGSDVRATNEDRKKVSVGYAMLSSDIVDWIVLVESSRAEVWQPINKLRNVILACVFATAVLMAIFAYPLAHFASLPILRLRAATKKSMEPPGPSRSSLGSFGSWRDGPADHHGDEDDAIARKEGSRNLVTSWKRKRDQNAQIRREERRKQAFRIPGKVKERKYWIRDELSDLSTTFNEMSDELMMQYTRLEDRVQERTAELELSKKAAEAANESKTLFIANISHELKTPLNGILGMCAVCMQEDDPLRLKRSLGIIYKSGDLLLNLLTDLLTFSKNQVGQSLSLDEKEFRLRDVSSQILAIFEKQAKEGSISLLVEYAGIHDLPNDNVSPERQERGPLGLGRMRDMILWGDVHRILQVVINLVSNSLKFTPPGGSVVLTIRCLSEIPEMASRHTSINSRQSRQKSSRHRSSDGALSVAKMSTANAINVKDKPHALAYVTTQERAASPPPAGTYVNFEFEVSDTGPGIPENLLGKIFEPFVQGDLGLSKKYGGTGLGLSICSQLATLMKGGMSVRSTVGTGSVFTMKIPLRHLQSRADSSASSAVDCTDNPSRSSSIDDGDRANSHGPAEYREGHVDPNGNRTPSNVPVGGSLGNDSQPRLVGLSQPFFAASQPLESPGSQPAAMQNITDQASRGGKLRVLVAEDNKVNQEVVLRMLKLEDIYDVTVAKDGQEALDIVKESMSGSESCQPFNLIFMDVQMPNVDGLQSTRLIREIGYQAPIVALTAFAEESNIKDCLDSGMNYFLSKPIRRPQLKKVLKEYCAPIPEETEELTPPEQQQVRRGSPVNTTLVINGNSPARASGGLFSPKSPSTKAHAGTDDSRPVSPRSVLP